MFLFWITSIFPKNVVRLLSSFEFDLVPKIVNIFQLKDPNHCFFALKRNIKIVWSCQSSKLVIFYKSHPLFNFWRLCKVGSLQKLCSLLAKFNQYRVVEGKLRVSNLRFFFIEPALLLQILRNRLLNFLFKDRDGYFIWLWHSSLQKLFIHPFVQFGLACVIIYRNQLQIHHSIVNTSRPLNHTNLDLENHCHEQTYASTS